MPTTKPWIVIKERTLTISTRPTRTCCTTKSTTIDHALTRPWTVDKTYRRVVTNKPIWWDHAVCGEENAHVGIGGEVYYLSGDGLLMPAMKDQPAPDLRYFKKYDR